MGQFELVSDFQPSGDQPEAISSIHFFTTQEGELYIKDGRSTTAFKSTWSKWIEQLRKHTNISKFSERSIRNLVGSEDDLQTASERLGHT